MQAVEIFDGMHDCQLPVSGDPADAVCVPADDVTYASTISACQRNGQWQAALRVYEVCCCLSTCWLLHGPVIAA